MTTTKLNTLAVAAGRPSDPGEPLNEALILASNFVLGGERGYSRNEGTSTWDALETVVGALEDAEAVAFGSGMAAIAAVFELLPANARIVWPDDCYQGVAAVIAEGERIGRWTSVRVGVTDTGAWFEHARSADLIWLESPSNPLLQIADLRAIGGAERPANSLLVVDNTLAGPVGQRPLDVGTDIVVQAATKQLGGHSDLLCGVATTKRRELAAQLRRKRAVYGATPGALEAFLTVRGIRTYPLRAAAAAANAGELARRLAAHPAVELVRYPGLTTDPGHALAVDQLSSFGSMISFDVHGGAAVAERVLGGLQLIHHATSFGAVESTIERRAAIAGQEHIPPGLLRFSVGIEDVDDLWSDLAQALTGE